MKRWVFSRWRNVDNDSADVTSAIVPDSWTDNRESPVGDGPTVDNRTGIAQLVPEAFGYVYKCISAAERNRRGGSSGSGSDVIADVYYCESVFSVGRVD